MISVHVGIDSSCLPATRFFTLGHPLNLVGLENCMLKIGAFEAQKKLGNLLDLVRKRQDRRKFWLEVF